MMTHPNLNALWAARLMETLVANGVRRLVLSPGSRSTPLAIAAEACEDIEVQLAIDERAAAFFALGLARGSGSPVALACTSGTATVNYHPALVEAALTGVPLVVLTADRPARLRGLGAPQTIDQTKLYGDTVRHFQELPLPEFSAEAVSAMGAQVAFACAMAQQVPAGPVHLNVPFDEPLAPIPRDTERVAALASTLGRVPRVAVGRMTADEGAIAEASARLREARRPVLIAGPEATPTPEAARAVLAWAVRSGVPVVADIGAGLRGEDPAGATVCSFADAFLRTEDLGPDLVIRLGGNLTGKGIQTYLQKYRPATIAFHPDARGRDPEGLADLVVVGEVADAFRRLDGASEPGWVGRWQQAEANVAGAIARGGFPEEAAALRAAVAAMPEQGVLCLSNSLPIRHADTYMGAGPQGMRTVVYRGANGIDGVTAMSLGLAASTGRPTLLVTGDLAFLHDLGALGLARSIDTPVAILVLNNDGGGIFSYLPVADATPHFETLFGTPHGMEFSHAAALFGLGYVRAEALETVGQAVAEALATPGVRVIEFPSEREATAQAHKAFMADLAARRPIEARP